MKDFGSFFSVRDFFNYYMAGIVWLMAAFLIVLWFPGTPPISQTLMVIKGQTDALGPVVTGVLVVILPYIAGFTTRPLADLTAKHWCKKKGDPKIWVTDYRKSANRYKGQRLPAPMVKQINGLAKQTFGYEFDKGQKKYFPTSNLHLWFFQIRAYVLDQGGAAAELATRAYDLMNFSESLLLPVPLLFSVLSYGLIAFLIESETSFFLTGLWRLQGSWGKPSMSSMFFFRLAEIQVHLWIEGISLLVGIPLSALVFRIVQTLLFRNYSDLRENWVKHVYRAFFVIKARESQQNQAVTCNEQSRISRS